MRSALAATFIIVLLAMSCAYCATAPAPYPDFHPYLGGPIYRVYDVDEIDSIDEAPSLYALYQLAEECTGVTRDYSPIRVFAVSRIEVRTKGGWSAAYNGMWTRGTGWVYLRRGRPPLLIARTLVHEYAHYLTQLSHDEINDIIKVCNAYINAKVAG